MVIAVGTPRSHQGPDPPIKDLLRVWGRRLWTFPEVLLAPLGEPIRVYRRGDEDRTGPSYSLQKNQFAAEVWDDAPKSRQLIDHFEGTLRLSRLQLVKSALECLFSREYTTYAQGDHTYALQGLLLHRPEVDLDDSAFQAFARLSMANDSDKLLEHMMCLSTPLGASWHSMEDTWEAQLWDIYPDCQIAGIGHNDTIILDGARAAAVRWKSFARVRSARRDPWSRFLTKIAIHTATLALLLGGLLLGEAIYYGRREEQLIDSISFSDTGISAVDTNITEPLDDLAETLVHGIAGLIISINGLYAVATIFLAYGTIMLLLAPYLLLGLYGAGFWHFQPWLFGFEGYLPVDVIEKQLFGERGRLQWSLYGSPLSQQQQDAYGDLVAVDPTTDPEVREIVARARTAAPGEMRVFSLVDTHSMTVTLFEARRPPVAFLLLGSEGGMQRAAGCSFEWTTGTLYPETVLRMETSSKDLMDLLPRARIGLRRQDPPLKRTYKGREKK